MSDLGDFVDAITGAPEGSTNAWAERVRAADAEAEAAWARALATTNGTGQQRLAKREANALIAIAAELRAQRIARRPGGGQT